MTPERIEYLKQACESSRMASLNEMIVDREELEWLIEQAEENIERKTAPKSVVQTGK
jgi:hypothetical protein